MAKIERSIDFEIPVRTAYNQWTQFEEFPKFVEGVVENVGDAVGVMSRRVEGNLERLKAYIEARRHESGAWRGEIPSKESGRSIA